MKFKLEASPFEKALIYLVLFWGSGIGLLIIYWIGFNPLIVSVSELMKPVLFFTFLWIFVRSYKNLNLKELKSIRKELKHKVFKRDDNDKTQTDNTENQT